MTISDSTITLSSAGTVSIAAASTMSLTASTAIAFSLTSGSATGIDFGGNFINGYEYGTGTVSGTSVTINAQTGIITSATTTLAAGASETITLTNSRITAASTVLVNVQTRCSTGYVQVANTVAGTGSASIVVVNLGVAACTSTYTLGFFVAVSS